MSALATPRSRHPIRPPPGPAGLWLQLEPREVPIGPVNLSGAFRIARETPGLSRPHHRSIAIVLQQGLRSSVFGPFFDVMLFPDDEVETPQGFEGAFSIDTRAALEAYPVPHREGGRLVAFALLGTFVSNLVELDVGPW